MLENEARVCLGIDPGASGGLAVIAGDELDFVAMPPTESDIWRWLSAEPLFFAVIERNTGYVGDRGNPGSTMFKFGVNTGLLKGFLVSLGVPFEEVTPRTWQKALGIAPRKKGEKKGEFKNRLKAHAQKLFPGEAITLAVADAILIAEHCRRKHATVRGLDRT
jgi:hypothetical protein